MEFLRLRYTQPDMIRPIKVPMVFPVIYLLATAFVVIVPMVASPVETGIGCLMILTGVPVYFIFVVWKTKPKAFQKAMGEYPPWCALPLEILSHQHKLTGALTQKLQKLLMVVRPKSSQV
jgi:solute carrier family 7 (L-type amino acid transporter), member 8